MKITYRSMRPSDYERVRELWGTTPGIGMGAADEKGNILLFLRRNPHTSFVALDGRQIIGTALCGHDVRRAYIYHLAVRIRYQKTGVGTELLRRCLERMKARGIERVHLFVYRTNQKALRFYRHAGWVERKELTVFTRILR